MSGYTVAARLFDGTLALCTFTVETTKISYSEIRYTKLMENAGLKAGTNDQQDTKIKIVNINLQKEAYLFIHLFQMLY